MARKRKWRHAAATAVLCAITATAGSHYLGAPAWLTGLLFDSALSVSAERRHARPGAGEPHVAVIAIDSKSLDSQELAPYPRTLFGPVWALMIPALQDAGARVITFDTVFSYSANRFQANYDQTFLQALRGAKDQIVIGYSSRLSPTQTHMAALGFDQGALGSLDLFAQDDGILRSQIGQRKLPNGETVLGLAGATLARAGADTIADEIIPAPAIHPESLPTYSLIDVLRCAGEAPQALKAAFDGKVIFIGTTLPEEDRIISSSRFLPPPRDQAPESHSCGLRTLAASAPDSSDVPGVHLVATAVQSILSRHAVERVDTTTVAALAGLAALTGVFIGLTLAPALAVAASIAIGALLWGAEAYLLMQDKWLDIAGALVALLSAAVISYLVRYTIEERSRKRIQKAFGHYLAPALVDQLADNETALQLGGEQREATIMFADLSGFTALSGILGPEALVETTNTYLKIIADSVDESGGYVDKFIGDAVMAIWGAPAADPDHPVHAVEAALEIAAKIADMRERAATRGDHAFDIKIGVNTGPVVVGNVGSDKRYNYTAVGEAVNIAARLESLPGVYNCRIVIGPETATKVSDRFELREIDAVTVKGKAEPLRIFEPLAGTKEARHSAFAEALRLYRGRDFSGAAQKWQDLAAIDGPSSVMAIRAQTFAKNPPSPDWDGIFGMTEK